MNIDLMTIGIWIIVAAMIFGYWLGYRAGIMTERRRTGNGLSLEERTHG